MDKKSNGFSSGLGFVLAAAGSAVGLGNLWGFPYKTHANGGAAFVLVYIACVLFIGIITMVSEIFIGRRAQANPVTAFKFASPKFGWFGVLAVLIPAFIACYYSVLGGYTVRFAANSFFGNAGTFVTFASNKLSVIGFTAIFIGMALFVVMSGIKSGIERASKVLMPALFLILICIVIFSLCLGEGVAEGLSFYLKPDFSKLTGTGVLTAMGQAFYSLSLGMGAMVAYGSYTDKKINILKSTAMICICDTFVALLAGFAIFPAVYHYTATTGMEVESFQGVGLMFQTLPLVFEDLGFLGKTIGFFFFSMVAIAAVTSVISLLEVVCQFVIQKFRVRRKKAVFVLSLICFAVSVPVGISLGQVLAGQENAIVVFGQNLLDYFDIVTNTVLMPVCAFFGCITVGWIIGLKKTHEELEADGQKFGWFRSIFSVMVKYVTPLLIALIEVIGVYDLIYPAKEGVRAFSANGFWITLTAYGLLAVGVVLYFVFFKNGHTGSNADEFEIEGRKASSDEK